MSPRPYDISRNTRALLGGENWDKYGEPHQVLTAILMGLRNAGFDRLQAWNHLVEHNGSGASRLREFYKGKFDSKVQSKWHMIERRDATHQQQVVNWLKHVNGTFRIPRGGNTFRVAIALSEIARLAGSLTFTASERQISERAAVGTATVNGADAKTVRRALRRLVEHGWVTSEVSNHSSGTMQYTLVSNNNPITPPEATRSNGLINRQHNVDRDSRINEETGTINSSYRYLHGVIDPKEALSEAFSHAGLGFNSYRVLTLIRSRPWIHTKDVVRILCMSRQSASDALTRLSRHKLIIRSNAGEWSATNRSIADIVSELSLADRSGYRALAFKHQRENFERYQRYRGQLRAAQRTDSEPPFLSF